MPNFLFLHRNGVLRLLWSVLWYLYEQDPTSMPVLHPVHEAPQEPQQSRLQELQEFHQQPQGTKETRVSQKPQEDFQEPQESIPSCLKRRHSRSDLSLEGSSLKKIEPRRDFHTAAFYDSLSKVRLTRRALKELDRRTDQASHPKRPTHTPRSAYFAGVLKQIQRFASDGGPELRDLRGYWQTDNNFIREMDSRLAQSKEPPTKPISKSAKRSSAYNADFEQKLVDHHVYMENRASRANIEPRNLEEILQRLARRRPSLDPSNFTKSDFQAFKQANDEVVSEKKLDRTIFPTIHGNLNIPNEENIRFTRLDSLTDNTTVNAQPDFYDGVLSEAIDKRVREDLEIFIMPSTHQHAPAVPNFFTETKAPQGDIPVAKRQACYDGALGARAMHKLQSYKQEPVYDNKAYTFASTYQAGGLMIYAFHITPSSSGDFDEYNMTTVGGWMLVGDANTCRQGITYFRNARELAKEWRDKFISAANQKARQSN